MGPAELRLPTGAPVQQGQELLRVADPDGPWQLELHMPENRIGHVVEFQQDKYDASRERLRELLGEETRRKLGDAATDEAVAKAVEPAVDRVLDEKLHDTILADLPAAIRQPTAARSSRT